MKKSKLYVDRDFGRYVQEANDAEVLKFILQKADLKRIAVIGDVMLDVYINGTVGKKSPEGDFNVLKTTSESEYFGGAAHVAAQLKTFGCTVKLFSIVGCDEAGDTIKADFPDVFVDPAFTTTTKIRLIADGKQIARADNDMVSQYCFRPGEILTFTKGFKESLEMANVIVISDYNKGIVCQAMLDFVHDICARCDIPLIVDPKFPPFDKYFPAVTLTPNVAEFGNGLKLGGAFMQQPFFDKTMASFFVDHMIDNVVVTRGYAGVRIASRHADETVDFPALHTDNPNVCGAGDIVTAYLAITEAVGVTVWQAARLANLAAGLAVRKEGTPIVSPAEIFSHLGINV